MSTSTSLSSRRKQLRWRLTFSFTAVTVGALLAAELFIYIVGSGIVFILIERGTLPEVLIETVSTTYAPTLGHLLEETPEDLEKLAIWLETIRPRQPALGFSVGPTDGLLIIRSDGRLLAMSPPQYIATADIGEALDFYSLEGMDIPLRAALSGEEDPANLFSPPNTDNITVMTFPVWNDTHHRVAGALVMAVASPTVASVTGDLLALIGSSLIIFTIVAGLIGTLFGFLAGGRLSSRIDKLVQASQSWSEGDFSVRIQDPSEDELGLLVERQNQMARELEELLDARRELALVEERNRLARDLHDSSKQMAFAASAQINTVRRLIERDPQQARSHLEQADRLINDLREDLTNLIKELQPPVLKDKGLVLALKEVAADWSQQNGIELDFRVKNERALPLEIEQAVFKIIQEALSNVARHSQAGNVVLRLVYSDHCLECSIKDDGRGFDPLKSRAGFGLQSLQERAAGMGSELQISSKIGAGTEISFEVPLRDHN